MSNENTCNDDPKTDNASASAAIVALQNHPSDAPIDLTAIDEISVNIMRPLDSMEVDGAANATITAVPLAPQIGSTPLPDSGARGLRPRRQTGRRRNAPRSVSAAVANSDDRLGDVPRLEPSGAHTKRKK